MDSYFNNDTFNEGISWAQTDHDSDSINPSRIQPGLCNSIPDETEDSKQASSVRTLTPATKFPTLNREDTNRGINRLEGIVGKLRTPENVSQKDSSISKPFFCNLRGGVKTNNQEVNRMRSLREEVSRILKSTDKITDIAASGHRDNKILEELYVQKKEEFDRWISNN